MYTFYRKVQLTDHHKICLDLYPVAKCSLYATWMFHTKTLGFDFYNSKNLNCIGALSFFKDLFTHFHDF